MKDNRRDHCELVSTYERCPVGSGMGRGRGGVLSSAGGGLIVSEFAHTVFTSTKSTVICNSDWIRQNLEFPISFTKVKVVLGFINVKIFQKQTSVRHSVRLTFNVSLLAFALFTSAPGEV